MKYVRLKLRRLKIVQFALLLLTVGLLLGIGFANIFRTSYEAELISYRTKVFADITKNAIDYSEFFLYVLIKNFREFIIFWLLSITILGIPYMAVKICSFGFLSGFLISAITMQYGLKGMLLILINEFPHGLVYLPVAIICLSKGFELCRVMYRDGHGNELLNWLKANFFMIFLLIVAILFGCYLEAYAGAYLLKRILQFFY
jgi:stage II sporulation protein M